MSIDRDALVELLEDWLTYERNSLDASNIADRILALMRPVEGITLTPAAAGCALAWLDIARQVGYVPDGADCLVAARLRASS